MSVDWNEKFESVGLEERDCPGLLDEIERTEDEWQLASLLYIYGYSCRPNLAVTTICDRYIKDPVPGITAVCLRVVADYWSMWPNYLREIGSYLDLDRYDEWYDEVIFAFGFVSRNRAHDFPQEWRDKVAYIKNDPRARALGLIDPE